jgi:hypothetical protein
VSPDSVLSDIDAALDANELLLASMKRNSSRFDPFGPPYGPGPWAVGKGYIQPVSPPHVRYVTVTPPATRSVGGPVPSPTVEGSEPADTTVSKRHPLRVWWRALARVVRR